MFIKVCGITNLRDALDAVRYGANAIGFVRYPPSPRFVSYETIATITDRLPAGVASVGVFVKGSMEDVREELFDIIQLHGFAHEAELPPFRKRVLVAAGPGRLGSFPRHEVIVDQSRGTGKRADWPALRHVERDYILSGGLGPSNLRRILTLLNPAGIDVCSGVEAEPGIKDPRKLRVFLETATEVAGRRAGATNSRDIPDAGGHYGSFGGLFIPETLMTPLEELRDAFNRFSKDGEFRRELDTLLLGYSGRPTPLYRCGRLSDELGFELFLKREDLNHTGAHKINNTLGQGLLARRMGKRRVIAETGAGQHGVAAATACALLGLHCDIYMGTADLRRQASNARRMELLGARILPVDSGSGTLKDAVNAALRDWVTNVDDTYYLLGSAVGPHPYPLMVREFQSVIGREIRAQIMKAAGRLPDLLVACVGGGSNAIGMFHPFIGHREVRLVGVEAGGCGDGPGEHASRIGGGRPGVLHGTLSYLLQDENGQVNDTHSVSAGLDYPLIGPEHAWLHETGRAQYAAVGDDDAVGAFTKLCLREGIIPALESAHALAYAFGLKCRMPKDSIVVVNLSGRGDKDVEIVQGFRPR